MMEFFRYVVLNVEHRQIRYSNAGVKRYRHPLEYLSRLFQKNVFFFFFFFSQRKRLTIFGLFEGLWSVGTRFRH